MSDGTDDWTDYESDPFCAHWFSFGDGCDKVCKCGHVCERHCMGVCTLCECTTYEDKS
jgi:hypothetical protein